MSEHQTEKIFSRENMNIYQRMSAITAELKTVAKNLSVQTGGNSSYKAVSERDILDAVKPLEDLYGIYSYPCDREILEASILESQNNYGKKSTFFTRIKTTYMFVNVDNPEEKITTVTFSEGIDSQDKGSGKAMTYADKYALMKAYKISTGEDPDQNGSNDEGYTITHVNQRPPQQARTKCSKCGKIIAGTTRNDGSPMTAEEVASYAIQRFGAPYCVECTKKLQEQNAAARKNNSRNDQEGQQK